MQDRLKRVLEQHAALTKQMMMLQEELAAMSGQQPGPSVPEPTPVPPPVEPDAKASAGRAEGAPTTPTPAPTSSSVSGSSSPRGPQFAPPGASGHSLRGEPGQASSYPTPQQPTQAQHTEGQQRGTGRPQQFLPSQPAHRPPGAQAGPPPRPTLPPQGPASQPGWPPQGWQQSALNQPPPMEPPKPPAQPFWQRPDFTSKALTFGGVLVTLVGVGLLLTLAWQSGYFGPIPQLITAVVLSTALVAAGYVVHGRDASNLGGPALTATGFATAYGTVFVATVVYEWVTPIVGLGIAAGIALAGMLLAQRWSSQWLASAVVLGGVLLMMFVASGFAAATAGLFVVLLVAVSAGLSVKRPWLTLRFIEVVPAAIFLSVIAVDSDSRDLTLRMIIALLFLGVVLAATLGQSVLRVPTAKRATLALAVAALPTWVATSVNGSLGGWVALAVAAALACLWALRGDHFSALRTAGLALSAPTALVGASTLLGDSRLLSFALAGLAIAYLALAWRGDRTAAVLGAVLSSATLVNWLQVAVNLFDETHAVSDTARTLLTIVVAMLAWLVLDRNAERWFASRPAFDGQRFTRLLTAVGRFVVLALSSVAVLQLGHLFGSWTGDAELGLQVGNAVVSIGWIALSAAALARGLKSDGMTDVYWGLGLAAAAVAKLFLVDLGRLPGLVRVIAFLVVGLCLLAIGTRYAKALRAKQDAAARRQLSPQPQQPAMSYPHPPQNPNYPPHGSHYPPQNTNNPPLGPPQR